MKYRIEIDRPAQKFIERQPKKQQERIDRALSGTTDSTTDNRPEFQRTINDSAKRQLEANHWLPRQLYL